MIHVGLSDDTTEQSRGAGTIAGVREIQRRARLFVDGIMQASAPDPRERAEIERAATTIGARVGIGHRAIVHGAHGPMQQVDAYKQDLHDGVSHEGVSAHRT